MNNSDKGAFAKQHEDGLTKREYFAGLAMQAVITGYPDSHKANGCFIPQTDYPVLMQTATQIADELLNQLDQK